MVREGNEAEAPQPGAVPDDRLRRRAPHRARDQARDRRRARVRAARGCSSPTPTSRTAPASTRRRSPTSARPRSWRSRNGYQLCVHAIGDRANRETLNIFEEAFKANPDKKDLRWRVEHAQHLSRSRHSALRPARRDRLDAGHPLHVGRAVRPGAARREARRGRRLRLAEADEERRRRHATAPTRRSRTSIRSRATTRPSAARLKDGSVFYPDQRMSRMEALKSYTLNGAYAAFEEGIAGIAEGRQVRGHRRAVEGHHDRARGSRSRPRRWSTRSSAGRSVQEVPQRRETG